MSESDSTGRVSLSDPFVRALKAAGEAREVWDAEQPGLLARVLPSGRLQWAVRYRINGQRRRFGLGEYPAVKLSEARTRARKAQSAVDDGKDPAKTQRAAKAKPAAGDTVEALVRDYIKRYAALKRSGAGDERALTVEVLPTWGKRAVKSLTRRDVLALVEGVVDRGSPIMANRLLALVRKLLNYAVDNSWIDANPAARIEKPSRETSRERVLSDDELRRLWRLLSHFPTTAERPAPGRKASKGSDDDPICPVSEPLAAALKVRLLTAQRGGEVIKMKWRDVDLDSGWWTIPGTDTKNGRTHRVALVPSVVEIIKAQTPDEKTPEDERSEFVFCGDGESLADRLKKSSAEIAEALDVDFRGHDLRRSAATRMAEAGVPRDHISKVLNHAEGGPRATQVYDRHTYDREKRVALETWDRTLTAILEAKPKTSNVIPHTRKARAR